MEVFNFAICALLLMFFSTHTAYTADVLSSDPSVSSQVEDFLASDSNDPSSGTSIACVLLHCLKYSAACLLDSNCRTYMECSQKCMNGWGNDTTPGKFHVQNCTSKCSFSYGDETIENFMSCLTENNCVSFPSIPSPCKKVQPLKQIPIEDLKGSWWVVRGYHPVFDCYPCAHPNFEPINATMWSYNPNYLTYLVNETLKPVHMHFEMPYQPPGEGIPFVYHDMGLDHYKTWWIIDEAVDKSYILLYYCGNTLQWYYEGSIVLARNLTLSEEAYADIAVSYQKAVGLNLTSFCDARTSNCPD